MKAENARLFVKSYCPWCHEAEAWLKRQGVTYERLDVHTNPTAYTEMIRLSGQSRAPVIQVDGHVLADFGADELEVWWAEQGFATKS